MTTGLGYSKVKKGFLWPVGPLSGGLYLGYDGTSFYLQRYLLRDERADGRLSELETRRLQELEEKGKASILRGCEAQELKKLKEKQRKGPRPKVIVVDD